ncbi:MAG: hypothetical protein M1834_008921 [Cirrosporium novae-zelandiae]|nr:MAG: hypothetical protein M1834_008921 [Cirrosporium novae-zelandiae]
MSTNFNRSIRNASKTMDPITHIISGVGPAVNVTIKLFEITFALKAASEQTADLISTTGTIEHQIHEALRLRSLKTTILTEDECKWIDFVISDTTAAVRNIMRVIEPARVDMQTMNGGMSIRNRALWVFRDSDIIADKHRRLGICANSLGTVINTLYIKQGSIVGDAAIRGEMWGPPPVYQENELLTWKRSAKKKSKNDLTNGRRGVQGRTCIEEEAISSATSLMSPSISTATAGEPPLMIAVRSKSMDTDNGTEIASPRVSKGPSELTPDSSSKDDLESLRIWRRGWKCRQHTKSSENSETQYPNGESASQKYEHSSNTTIINNFFCAPVKMEISKSDPPSILNAS